MFAVQKTLIQATSVTHATLCYFSSTTELDLILIRGHSVLQLWRLEHNFEQSFSTSTKNNDTLTSPTLLESFTSEPCLHSFSSTPLTLFAEWPLYGHVIDMGHVHFSFFSPFSHSTAPDPRECLLITFNEAKAVVLMFDPHVRTLRSISLHCFEKLDWLQPTTKTPFPPLLRMEPSGRCALIQIYQDQWAILPFRQSEIDSETFLTTNNHEDQRKENEIISFNEKHKATVPQDIPPYLPSFVIKTKELPPSGIIEIRDVQFVAGYLDPTLAVLHEPSLTWVGHLNTRKDTIRCTFLSLDLQNQHHPTLFTSSPLPSSCYQMVTVPHPLGGILVFSSNAVIYLSQSNPNGIAMSVNAYHALESNYTVTYPCQELNLHLDNACVSFLQPNLCLLALSMHELWTLELVSDAHIRGVSKFRFTRIARVPPVSCLVPWPLFVPRSKTLTSHPPKMAGTSQSSSWPESHPRALNNLVFIGSATGSSLLVSISKTVPNPPSNYDALIEVGNSVHGFTVVDLLPSVGNFKDAILIEMMGRKSLFTLGGHELGGHISFFEQMVHPIFLNRYKMGGARRIWAVKTDRNFDSLLILSGDHQTIVFSTVGELHPIRDTDFELHQKTIYVGQVCLERVVQILERSVRLISHLGNLLQEIQLPASAIMASIAFRHVAILLEGHCVQVYYFSENSSDNACLELIYTEGDVTWIQLFNDTESVFISGQQLNAIQHQTRILQQKQKTVSLENALDVMELQDDLDMDFYGEDEDENKEEKEQKKIDLEFEKEQLEMNETNAAFPSAIPTSVSSPSSHSKETSPPIPGETKNGSENAFTFDTFPPISSNSLLPSTMILMTLKSSNTLQFTKLPSSPSIAPAVVFTCTNLISLSEVLHNSSEEIPLSDESITSIDQAHLVSLGSKVDDVYLLLVTSDANLIFYRAFHPDPPIHFSDTLAGVLFVRQHSNLQILMSTSNPLTGKQISVHPFKNIHHQPGLFVIRGREPSIWIMASRRSSLHAYSMDLGIVKNHKFPVHSKAHVTGFSPFHHPNCPFGFLLATSQGHLALSVLDELMNFDMELPYRTVPTYRTSHFASYQSETLTFALISSHVVDFKLIIEVPDQQEHNAPSGMKVPFISPEILEQRQLPEGAYPPQVRQFQVDLISTVNLAIADSYFFDEYEYVLAVVTVPLECKQAPSGKKPFLVVGTSFAKGEDVATRGKLYVFDVITVVPEPGKPETSHRLKLLAVEDVKAPVTALASFHGHLLVGTGAKIILYDFEDMERLIGVAFHDTHLFVNHVVTFKAFILAGDMYKSIMLFAWQEDPPKLILVSKDHHPLSTTALSLLIQGDLAGFLVGDDEGGLNLLLYSPYHIQSYGGMKLLRWGDLYLGSVVEKLIHYRMRPNSLISLPDPSFCCLYLCKDGSIGVVAPVSEVMYKRFLLMYNQLTSNLFPLASLHPKAFRRTLSQHRMYSNKQMTLLDLNIFNDFFQLSFADQKRHTAAVGTSLTRVQLDLKMLQNAWTVL